jgi:hypothetical protein
MHSRSPQFYWDFTGRTYVIYGEHFQPDILCAYDLSKMKGTNIYTIKNEPHSLPPYIHNRYGLSEFIFTTISSGHLPFEQSEMGDLLDAGESVHVLYVAFMEVKRDKLTLRAFNELLRLEGCNIKSESFVKYVNKYLGIFYFHFAEYTNAIGCLKNQSV